MKNYSLDRREFVASDNWSVSNALHMMKLSYAVYAGTTDDIGSAEDWSITRRLVTDAGYQLQKIEAKNGIYEPNAMICWDDKCVFLIFRGTEPVAWNQWVTNANLRKTDFCIGRIHRGFLNSVELIWSEVLEGLRQAGAGQGKALFVGGHSLGAGMSQAAVAKLVFESCGFRVWAAYHFGSPRALDKEAARRYQAQVGENTYRVVNGSDLVCNIPPEEIGFCHVGQLKFLDSSGRLLEDPPRSAIQLANAKGGLRGLREMNPVTFITDHLPDSYTFKLTQLQQGGFETGPG